MLKIKRHIIRTSWMIAPETVKLFNLLQNGGGDNDPKLLFVGGCVRDILLGVGGRDIEDIDIATKIIPKDVVSILSEAGIKVIPIGIDYGTVRAIIGQYSYEITTLRRDVETDGRHAFVSYSDSWIEDARRRDFTINTLLMDLSGNIYDPLGVGLKDIDKKLVRFVGDAKQRIEEDHLRILRFFRFSALYCNNNQFDKDGLKACKIGAANVYKLSKERITQEFFKILTSDKASNVLSIMFENNILKELDFGYLEFLNHLCRFQSMYKLSSLSSRLFVMAGLDFSNIEIMGKIILLPKVFLKDMLAIKSSLSLDDLSCDQVVRESVYRFGRVATAQSLMIELAQDRVINSYAPKALEIIKNWDIPVFPVKGEDLIAEGMKPSPEIGAKLRYLENKWIKNGFAL